MSENQGKNQMSKASQALLEIYNSMKQIMSMFYIMNTVQKDNNDMLKNISKKLDNDNKASSNVKITVPFDQMLYYISKRPMWKLSDKQIYYMVERGDDIRYIQAVSGYNDDEIKKKYKKHKDSNVYR